MLIIIIKLAKYFWGGNSLGELKTFYQLIDIKYATQVHLWLRYILFHKKLWAGLGAH